MKTIIFAALLLSSVFLHAQTSSCSCCSTNYTQFDFWLGEWIVLDTNGNKLGENRIEKIEGNCILNEHWSGVQGGTGSSYNYFEKKDSTWNQLWIDNSGNSLKLQGKLIAEGVMQLQSELQQGKNRKYYNRITWTKNEDGTVTQLWEILDTEEKVLKILFKGIYHPKV